MKHPLVNPIPCIGVACRLSNMELGASVFTISCQLMAPQTFPAYCHYCRATSYCIRIQQSERCTSGCDFLAQRLLLIHRHEMMTLRAEDSNEAQGLSGCSITKSPSQSSYISLTLSPFGNARISSASAAQGRSLA
jgi:hypothetical protein